MRRAQPPSLLIAITCLLLGLVCLSFVTGCASSRTGKALNVAVVGSAVADYHSTRTALSNGGREANPLAGQGALRQAIVKSVGTAGLIGVAHLVELKGRPVLSHLMRAVAITAWSVVAAHNYKVWAR